LRELARACLSLLKEMLLKNNGKGKEIEDERAPWWMVVAVVVGTWGQRDIWLEAEEMVRSAVSQIPGDNALP